MEKASENIFKSDRRRLGLWEHQIWRQSRKKKQLKKQNGGKGKHKWWNRKTEDDFHGYLLKIYFPKPKKKKIKL